MKKIFIIAEAGVNHNGDIKTALRMVDAAASAGADAVKFQTCVPERTVSKFAPKAVYQKKTTGSGSQLAMIKRFKLDEDDYGRLMARCKKRNIVFISTPFDIESVDLLHKLGLKIFKIPSGEITNLPYLRKVGGLKKRIILSTGMADMKEVRDAVKILTGCGTKKDSITVLHCNTAYPTSLEDVNLLAMITIKKALNIRVGYSDHTSGIDVPAAAAALGAEIIEKHFTLNRMMKGPDHKASLEPEELKAMVRSIRNIEKALGGTAKRMSRSEAENRSIARKSIVAARDIKAGEVFTDENIAVKRPGTGISPMKWDSVMGRIAKNDFMEDEPICI